MGRWAQSRRRGCNMTASTFIVAPPGGSDWAIADASDLTFTVTVYFPPVEADSYNTRFKISGTEVWSYAGNSGGFPDFAFGVDSSDFYDIEIQWAAGGEAISDWSSPKSAEMP